MNCPYCNTNLGDAEYSQCQSCSGTPRFNFPFYVVFYFEINGNTVRILHHFSENIIGISTNNAIEMIIHAPIYSVEDAQQVFDRFIKLRAFI